MGLIAMSKGNYPMAKLVNPKIFNAVKHGVSSRHGLLPGENREDYASLEAQWRGELQPRGPILNNLLDGIVRNRWLGKRNSQATAIFAACHPFGRAVAAAAGGGDWVEAARRHLDGVNARLITLMQTGEQFKKQAVRAETAAEVKRLITAAEKCADAAQRIATDNEQAMKFFLGIGDESKKQADRDVELDGKFNKLLTSYFQVEQMLVTRVKLVPHLSHHTSADDLGDFGDELPEELESKGGHSTSQKRLVDPAEGDHGELGSWDMPPEH
jgi:hypothetical protein